MKKKTVFSLLILIPIGLAFLFSGCSTQPSPQKQVNKAPSVEKTFLQKAKAIEQKNNYPEFSWDTLPLYMHIRKVKAFNQKELEYLASFPLITFEKTSGVNTYGSTDAGSIEAAKAVKKINPKTKTLFYRNVIVHYGGYSFDKELETFDSPFLKNKKGESKVIRNRLYAYDLSNPKVVDWWVKSASNVCADEAIDGLFLDGNIKGLTGYLGRITPNKETKDAWSAGYDDMMMRTRKNLGPDKLMIANIIRVAYFPDGGLKFLNEYFDGSYLEGFDMGDAPHLAKGIAAVQKAARSGKIIAMTLGLGKSAVELHGIDDARKDMEDISKLKDHVDFSIALFLICAEKHSYLYLHDGYCADIRKGNCMSKMWLKRLPEYDKPLGPPKGPAVKNDNYIYERQFQNVHVTLDLVNRKGKLVWLDEKQQE